MYAYRVKKKKNPTVLKSRQWKFENLPFTLTPSSFIHPEPLTDSCISSERESMYKWADMCVDTFIVLSAQVYSMFYELGFFLSLLLLVACLVFLLRFLLRKPCTKSQHTFLAQSLNFLDVFHWWIYYTFLRQYPIEGHLHCFQSFAFINNTEINLFGHTYLPTCAKFLEIELQSQRVFAF